MNTYYEKEMSELCRDYNSFISQAENTNRRNNYAPTPEEFQCYMKAAETARKIVNINSAQKHVYKQWSERAAMCEKKAMNIYRMLNPEPEKKPHPSASSAESADSPDANAPAPSSAPQNAASSKAAKDEAGYTTTASGFRTRNASEEVSAETIEKWYMDPPDHTLDDVVGMDEMKKIIKEELLDNIGWDETDDFLKISKLKSFLFYGPFGTGKSYFIEAVARELMDKGFKFMQLTGADVHDSYVGVGEKVVKTAFKEAVDNAPCIMYFDEFESMCAEREGSTEGHEKRLSVAFMESYNLIKNSNKPIVFLAATNYPDRVEHAMLSRIITFVPVPLPSEEVRLDYFNKALKGLSFESGFDSEYMADSTDNYSFRDLARTTDKIKITIKNEARQKFSVYDSEGRIMQKESDEAVRQAMENGSICVTKEIFDNTQKIVTPEKKSDILASIQAFEEKR